MKAPQKNQPEIKSPQVGKKPELKRAPDEQGRSKTIEKAPAVDEEQAP